jgi:TIGR03009 family protein
MAVATGIPSAGTRRSVRQQEVERGEFSMTTRISLAGMGILIAVSQAMGQTSPYQPPPQDQPASQVPDRSPQFYAPQNSVPQNSVPQYPSPQEAASQNMVPQDPNIQRRAPQQPPVPPFVLTPQEQQQLDMVLQGWEQHSKNVRTFECKFTRFEYDPTFGDANKPRFEDNGEIKYAAPDKGMFRVDAPRREHWVCDGQSIFEYNFLKKELIEYKLPPDMHGQAIADGPLPFLFGADAKKLKQRYYLRVTDQPAQNEFWLEARPKYQRDAANFVRARLILQNMQPHALETYSPNGKDHTSYLFENIRVNARDPLAPLRFFQGDPFRAATPPGWRKIVEPAAGQPGNPPAHASGQPAPRWR